MKKVGFLILLFLAIGLNAQFGKIGNNGVKFLDIEVDARGIGMGGAYGSIAEGAPAVFWNPGGVALGKGINIFTHYNRWWGGIMHGVFSFTYDLGLNGVVGVFFNGVYSGDIEETTVDQPDGTGSYVSYYGIAGGVTYSRFLTDRFAFGVNLKGLREIYPPTHTVSRCLTTGICLDVGGLYRTDFRDMKVGIALFNFGPDIKPTGNYDDFSDGVVVDTVKEFKPYPTPTGFRGGISMLVYEMEGVKVIGAFDVYHPSDNVERYSVGLETTVYNMVSIRAGYCFGRDDNILGFNGGIGINAPIGAGKMAVDFAYSDARYLPGIYRVSVKLGF